MTRLFDTRARAQRRNRAFRNGPVLFLYERAFAEIVDRIGDVKRSFSSALLIGTPDPSWPQQLAGIAGQVTAVDPGSGFAQAAGGMAADEDSLAFDPESFDLCIAVGTLDSVDDLPGVLLRLRFLLKPDSLLIGVMAGGDTLPRLRQAMRTADAVTGMASPHAHPRVEPAALAQLLTAAGFAMPVVDVERERVSYRDFRTLVADLRGMGVTNVLTARSRMPLSRAALNAAKREFEREAKDSRTIETFELLHFAAWTPGASSAAERG